MYTRNYFITNKQNKRETALQAEMHIVVYFA